MIPAAIRRKYDIQQGTRIAFVEEHGRVLLEPITPEFIDSLMGSLKQGPSLLKALRRERKRDWRP